MESSYQLRIPGPTPIPERVRRAMDAPMINHRGPEFKALLKELEDGLRWAFDTTHDLLIYPASGSGGMESAVANLVSPGERVLAITIGAFGDRFADLAQAFGADVVRYALPWGEAADPEDLDAILAKEDDVHTVLITHNETSTGVLNPLQQLASVVKQRGRLLVVDGVSSIGSVELPVDDWGVDVAITASQKGWMLPPGVTMLTVSPAARPAGCPSQGAAPDLARTLPSRPRLGPGTAQGPYLPHRPSGGGLRGGRHHRRHRARGGAQGARPRGQRRSRALRRAAGARGSRGRRPAVTDATVPRVLVADPIAEAGIARLRSRAEVDVLLRQPEGELRRRIPDYDALIVRSETRVDEATIAAGVRLKVIGRAGAGVDNIDLQAATRAGVLIVNAPAGNTVAAAEHTLALMLALARHVPQAAQAVRQGRWERSLYLGTELREKTLGVIGLGNIGREVARRAQAFGMQVIAADPLVPE